MMLRVEPEEFIYLVKETNPLDDEVNQAGILTARYPDNRSRVFCITERMQCLVEMMKDNRMRGWAMDATDPECNLTEEAV